MNPNASMIKACITAWLHCQHLLEQLEQQSTSFSARTQQVLEQCAQLCLYTGHAVKNGLVNRHKLALLCVGLCEECAEVCERYAGSIFRQCALACRQCSALVTPMASAAV